MVASMGGPIDFIEHADQHLERAPVEMAAYPVEAGYVAEMDTRAVGVSIIELGGGRRRVEDGIDFPVGYSQIAGPGELVDRDRPLADRSTRARAMTPKTRSRHFVLRSSFAPAPPAAPAPLIYERVGPDMARRAFLLVLDSLGVGGAADAARFKRERRRYAGPHRCRMRGGARR